jgi:hypothetical protein
MLDERVEGDAKQTYFHCSGTSLGVGSIIEPGNWGRMLNLYEAAVGSGLPTNVFREALLEQARQIYAPDKVSRLKAIFAVPTLPEAIAFRDQFQKTNIIYEVDPIDPESTPTAGDYQLATAPYPVRYFSSMFEFARRYWVDPPQRVELLFACPMRVLRVANMP